MINKIINHWDNNMKEISNLKIVPERIIIDANQACLSMGELDNNFGKLLEQANIFRTAGLTPVYILNEDDTTMTVSSKEILNSYVH